MSVNKMSIPQVRDRLRELAIEHNLDELNDLADQTYRRTARRRAPIKSPKLTPEMAEDIRRFVAANPDMHQQDVAQHFGVNHGRVSEALDNQV